MDKEFGWWIERFGGPVMALLTVWICYKINFHPECITNIDAILSKTSDLSFIIFGFLLAFVGLIINAKQKIIDVLKDKTFNNVIGFNTRVIVLALVIGAFSFILWTVFQTSTNLACQLKRLLIIVLGGGLVWLICDLIYFIRVFFNLIKRYS